jgi:hypothetical protein
VKITRIVTHNLPDGTSDFASNGPADPVDAAALAGFTFYPMWATEQHESLPDGASRDYFPGPDGTRLVGVTWAPAGHTSEGSDSEADIAEAEALLPGLLGVFEPGTPFHTTQSIDYGICLDGEMWLMLDDGRETRITPGTVVVQRGTRHAWENRSDKPATMVFAQVGGDAHRY